MRNNVGFPPWRVKEILCSKKLCCSVSLDSRNRRLLWRSFALRVDLYSFILRWRTKEEEVMQSTPTGRELLICESERTNSIFDTIFCCNTSISSRYYGRCCFFLETNSSISLSKGIPLLANAGWWYCYQMHRMIRSSSSSSSSSSRQQANVFDDVVQLFFFFFVLLLPYSIGQQHQYYEHGVVAACPSYSSSSWWWCWYCWFFVLLVLFLLFLFFLLLVLVLQMFLTQM